MCGSISRVLMGFAVMAVAMPLPGQTAVKQTAPCPVAPPKPQPYTAELKITSVQTLADGTTITREGKEVRARDSQGRYVNLNSGTMYSGGMDEVMRANARDPVAGTQTDWDSQSRKATVIKLPPGDHPQGCWADEAGHLRFSFGPRPSPVRNAAAPKTGTGTAGSSTAASTAMAPIPRPRFQNRTNEDLGTTTIMGIEAHGYRNSFTTPVGEMGNDRPMVHTSETWTAPGYDFPLRQVDTDPQSGTRTTEVVNLELSEPDPAAFQPPEGYEVVVEELHGVPCQQMGTP